MSNESKKDGLRLVVKVTPRASMTKLVKLDPISAEIWAFKAMVTEVPEQGKANAAVIKLLASELGVSKSQLNLIQGHKDRAKTILLSGDKEEIIRKLNSYTGKS